jgi:hypothetical protein
MERFPADFMFELTHEELENWRCHFGTTKREKMGLRRPPFAFTEHGVLMLASVLNSSRAILVNIRLVRIFVKLRTYLATTEEFRERLEKLEMQFSGHDEKILLLFEYIKRLVRPEPVRRILKNRRRIGFSRE